MQFATARKKLFIVNFKLKRLIHQFSLGMREDWSHTQLRSMNLGTASINIRMKMVKDCRKAFSRSFKCFILSWRRVFLALSCQTETNNGYFYYQRNCERVKWRKLFNQIRIVKLLVPLLGSTLRSLGHFLLKLLLRNFGLWFNGKINLFREEKR